jgi:hypothetical protein
MDIRTWEIIIAIAFIVFGAIMVFNEKHYSSASWKPSKLTKNSVGAGGAKRLAKFQGKLLILMGIGFFLHWLFW